MASCSLCNCRVPSLAKKYLMALSGLVLAGFALVHMIGNLQMFQSPEHINVYAHFLQHLPPPALWGFRAVMLGAVAIHAITGISLVLENRAARGAEKYTVKQSRVASLAAKTMPYSGLVLLAFVVFHILHYTVKAPAALGTGAFHDTLAVDVHAKLFGVFDYPIFKGETVNDCYNMVVTGFSNPVFSAFYIVAMLLLALHLSHGVASIFQTIGVRNEKWRTLLDYVAALYGVVLFAGLAAVPAGVLAGKYFPSTKCPVAVKHQYATNKTAIFKPKCSNPDCPDYGSKYHPVIVTAAEAREQKKAYEAYMHSHSRQHARPLLKPDGTRDEAAEQKALDAIAEKAKAADAKPDAN